MSETQTPTVESNVDEIIKNSPFHKPITITRNGVSETLKVFVGQRGEWKDKPYAAVQIEIDDTAEIVHDHAFIKALTFIGKSNVRNYINTILKRVAQDYSVDSTSEITGEFSLDAFIKSWENLAAAGLKLSELKELLDNEQRKHEAFIGGEALELLGHGKGSPEYKQAKDLIDARTKSINALRFELEQRQQRRSKEVNTETVSPV